MNLMMNMIRNVIHVILRSNRIKMNMIVMIFVIWFSCGVQCVRFQSSQKSFHEIRKGDYYIDQQKKGHTVVDFNAFGQQEQHQQKDLGSNHQPFSLNPISHSFYHQPIRVLQYSTISKSQSKSQAISIKNNKKKTRQQIKYHQIQPDNSSSNYNQDTANTVGIQVIIIIIAVAFGIPLLLIFIFALASLIRKCMVSGGELPQLGIMNNNTTNDHQQSTNLDHYKLQQLGAYHMNVQQKCPICLDQNINLRTVCGHYYHVECLKEWLVKGMNKKRCPVCVSVKISPVKIYCNKCRTGFKLMKFQTSNVGQLVVEMTCSECLQQGYQQQGSSFVIADNAIKTQTPQLQHDKKLDQAQLHQQQQQAIDQTHPNQSLANQYNQIDNNQDISTTSRQQNKREKQNPSYISNNNQPLQNQPSADT